MGQCCAHRGRGSLTDVPPRRRQRRCRYFRLPAYPARAADGSGQVLEYRRRLGHMGQCDDELAQHQHRRSQRRYFREHGQGELRRPRQRRRTHCKCRSGRSGDRAVERQQLRRQRLYDPGRRDQRSRRYPRQGWCWVAHDDRGQYLRRRGDHQARHRECEHHRRCGLGGKSRQRRLAHPR